MNILQDLQNCYRVMQSGDLAQAERLYQNIISAHPEHGDALHLGAMIAYRGGEHAQALTRIEKASKANPGHFEILNTKGNILSALQNIPQALAAFRASLAAKPDYVMAAQNLGKCLIDNKDPLAALDVYKAALEQCGDHERLQIGYVIALKEAGKYAKALQVLDAMPEGKNYSYVRGQILLGMEKFDQSIVENERALLDPLTAGPALQNIMQVLWMRGQWDTAQKHIDMYLTKAGNHVPLYVTAARLLAKADDKSAAYALLARAEHRHGPAPEILAARARFNLEDGDMETAYENAYKALSAKPGHINIMADFADSALATGRANEALGAAQAALKRVPNNQFWIAVHYTALRALGQNHRAFTNTEKFVQAYEIEPPKGYASLEEYNQALKHTLDELHGLSEHPLDQSLRNGTQTVPDLRFVEHPLLKAHFKALEKPIRAYMHHIGFDPAHPLLRRNTEDYLIAGAWSVKLRKKGFHVSHVHPEGWISSAYYVDVPDEVKDTDKKSGWIHFGKPPFDVVGQDGKPLGYEKIVQPKAGTLVLFPSYLWHGTNALTKDAARMTLPIDVVPA